MIVIVLTVSPPRLRGHLTRWLFEISPGIYVGKVSARVRELLWEQILENLGGGRAVMVYPSNNEQGLEFRTRGQEWQPVDYDGLELIMRPNTNQKQQRNAARKSGAGSSGEHATSVDAAERATGAAAGSAAGRTTGHTTGWSKASRYRKFGRRAG